jgi:phosphonate transport system substrate-binding protein
MHHPERRFRDWLFALLLGALLAACDRPAPTDQPPSARPWSETPPLLFAVYPYDTPSQLAGRFEPLCAYLGTRLGQPVQLYLAHSYGDQIRRISHGQTDLAYLGPTPYLRARDRYLGGAATDNLEILAGETLDGEPGYHAVVVTLASGPLHTLADLRGQTLALGDPRSFSSHFVPRALLAQAGLTLADLRDYAYLGRHERVALAVVHGDFAAGGLREDVAARYLDRGLRVIARSALLPPHLVVARPRFDRALANAVRAALIAPDDRGRAAMGPGVGFAPVEDARFDPVRATVRAIEGMPLEGLPPW